MVMASFLIYDGAYQALDCDASRFDVTIIKVAE